MIPLLYHVPPLVDVGELSIQEVAGLSMTQVLAGAAVGAWSHGRHALVHPRLALIGGSVMAAGALPGALGSSHVSGRALLAIFALMATAALPLMFVAPTEVPPGDDPAALRFSRPAAVGFPGGHPAGGGHRGRGRRVPAGPGPGRRDAHPDAAQHRSLAMVGMAAVTGFVGKVLTDQVPLWPAATVVLGSLGGAPLGGRVSRRVPVMVLRGVLAGIIALVMPRVWLDVATH